MDTNSKQERDKRQERRAVARELQTMFAREQEILNPTPPATPNTANITTAAANSATTGVLSTPIQNILAGATTIPSTSNGNATASTSATNSSNATQNSGTNSTNTAGPQNTQGNLPSPISPTSTQQMRSHTLLTGAASSQSTGAATTNQTPISDLADQNDIDKLQHLLRKSKLTSASGFIAFKLNVTAVLKPTAGLRHTPRGRIANIVTELYCNPKSDTILSYAKSYPGQFIQACHLAHSTLIQAATTTALMQHLSSLTNAVDAIQYLLDQLPHRTDLGARYNKIALTRIVMKPDESIAKYKQRFDGIQEEIADARQIPLAAVIKPEDAVTAYVGGLAPLKLSSDLVRKITLANNVAHVNSILQSHYQSQHKPNLNLNTVKAPKRGGKDNVAAFETHTEDSKSSPLTLKTINDAITALTAKIQAMEANTTPSRGKNQPAPRKPRTFQCSLCGGNHSYYNCKLKNLDPVERAKRVLAPGFKPEDQGVSTHFAIAKSARATNEHFCRSNQATSNSNHGIDGNWRAKTTHIIDSGCSARGLVSNKDASPLDAHSFSHKSLTIDGFNNAATVEATDGNFGRNKGYTYTCSDTSLHGMLPLAQESAKIIAVLPNKTTVGINPADIPAATPVYPIATGDNNVAEATPQFLETLRAIGPAAVTTGAAMPLDDVMEGPLCHPSMHRPAGTRVGRKRVCSKTKPQKSRPSESVVAARAEKLQRTIRLRNEILEHHATAMRLEAYNTRAATQANVQALTALPFALHDVEPVKSKDKQQQDVPDLDFTGAFMNDMESNSQEEMTAFATHTKAYRVLRTSNNAAVRYHRRHGHPSKSMMKKLLNIWKQAGLSDKQLRTQHRFTAKDLREFQPCAGCDSAVFDKYSHKGTAMPDAGRFIVDDKKFRIRARNGYRYQVVFVHDTTRYTFVYSVKDVTKEAMVQTFNKCATDAAALGIPIKKLRFDPGKNFANATFINHLNAKGVQPEQGATEAHYYTGKVERRIRELTQKARVVLADAMLPYAFMPDAFAYACDALNNLPTSTHGEYLTPAQQVRGDPTYAPPERYPFGATAYVRLTDQEMTAPVTNVHPRAYPAIYLGHMRNGYHHVNVWDPVRRKVLHRDNVAVDECTELITADRLEQMHNGNFRRPFSPFEEEQNKSEQRKQTDSDRNEDDTSENVPLVTKPVMKLRSKSKRAQKKSKKLTPNAWTTPQKQKEDHEAKGAYHYSTEAGETAAKAIKAAVANATGHDHWGTPDDLKAKLHNIFKFDDYDPAPYKGESGLDNPFEQSTFINPPYKDLASWTAKMKHEYSEGKNIVALLPYRIPQYYFDNILPCDTIHVPIQGRVRFKNLEDPETTQARAKFDSILYIFGYSEMKQKLETMAVSTTNGTNFDVSFNKTVQAKFAYEADIQADYWKEDKRKGKDIKIPKSIWAALDKSCPEHKDWMVAYQNELGNLMKLGVFEPASLPKAAKTIATRWVLQISTHHTGIVKKFKVRYVGKGFMQVPGRDYDANDIAAPVARFESHRALLALAARRKMHVRYIDFTGAFLQADLRKELYVKPLPKVELPPDCDVFRLLKAVPGLKQSAMAWYSKLTAGLEDIGFTVCPYDPCVYRYEKGGELIVLSTHVDDGLAVTTNIDLWKSLVEKLKSPDNPKRVKVSETGEPRKLLGMEVTLKSQGIFLSMAEKISDLATTMSISKHAKTPGLLTKRANDDEDLSKEYANSFATLLGKAAYIARSARPDVIFEVMYLARYQKAPKTIHYRKLERIVEYLLATKNRGILYEYGKKNIGHNALTGYVDSDFADCPATRRSTTGFVFYLNGAPISWTSRIQKLVTLSSTEAEYVAASEACCEGLWIGKLCSFLGLDASPIDLREDNTGVIARCVSPTYVFQRRSKHIEVKYHFINDQVKRGKATIEYVNTGVNPADVMTKCLPPCEFDKKVSLLVSDNMDVFIPSAME